jgi:tRNA dimethylallyltransferase
MSTLSKPRVLRTLSSRGEAEGSRKPKLIVILGPTASGKTELALKLAKKFGGEIVSADSRQIYKGMDVGTAKPLLNQKSKIKNQNYKSKIKNKFLRKAYYGKVDSVSHWLLDIVDPDGGFNVAEYKKTALAVIYDILKRGKQPFLVGGTGLYIQAIVDNLVIPQVPPNEKLRVKFEKDLVRVKDKRKKIKEYYKWLLKLDPGAKDLVSPENPRRIIRALEVCLATHQPFSKLRERGEPLFDVLQIGIDMPRKKLYERIDERADKMIEDGLISETKKLLKKYNPKVPSMSGIGYKEIGEFLSKKTKDKKQKNFLLKEAAQKIKFRTHAYARRQMTWFRKDKRIKWIKNYKECEKLIKKWLDKKPGRHFNIFVG